MPPSGADYVLYVGGHRCTILRKSALSPYLIQRCPSRIGFSFSSLLAMSFGFSIGDTLAVGKLITTIVVCLREVDGSAAEYRLLVQELECLEQTLRRLDALRPVDAKVPGDGGHREASSLDSIKVAALSCRHPLEQFLQGVRKKYGRSLGDAGHSSGAATARSGRVRAAVDKVRFAFWRDDIQTFQSYLSVHIGTINMMLAEHGFERLDRIASSMATKDEEESRRIVKEKMADAQEISSNLQGSLFSQLGAVFNGQAVMNRLLRMMSYDIRSTLSSIETTVAKLWLVTTACVFLRSTMGTHKQDAYQDVHRAHTRNLA